MNITRKRKLLETADERPSVSKNAVDLNHCIAESAFTNIHIHFCFRPFFFNLIAELSIWERGAGLLCSCTIPLLLLPFVSYRALGNWG